MAWAYSQMYSKNACFGSRKNQGNAVAVLSEPRQPSGGFVTVWRIEPHAAKPGLAQTVLLEGVVAFCCSPRPAPGRAGIQIKFSESPNELRRREPLILACGGAFMTPCPADQSWATGGLGQLGGRNSGRGAGSKMVIPAAHRAGQGTMPSVVVQPDGVTVRFRHSRMVV